MYAFVSRLNNRVRSIHRTVAGAEKAAAKEDRRVTKEFGVQFYGAVIRTSYVPEHKRKAGSELTEAQVNGARVAVSGDPDWAVWWR
jgi:hypothetical protein